MTSADPTIRLSRDQPRSGVSYLLLVHRSPQHVRRLARELARDGSVVLIHVDRRIDIDPFARAVHDVEGVALIEDRVNSMWASYGLVRAELNLLRHALRMHRSTHFVLLSGQDYPLQSASQRKRKFSDSEGYSFMSWSDGSSPPPDSGSENSGWYWDGRLDRLENRHYWIGGHPFGVPNRFIPLVPKRKAPKGMVAYQGSQWWALDHESAEYCIRTLERREDLVRYFRRCLASDEFVFQMLLLNSPLASRIVNDNLHYQSFDDWHASYLDLSELSLASRSHKLFARKVDWEVNARVVEALDSLLDN